MLPGTLPYATGTIRAAMKDQRASWRPIPFSPVPRQLMTADSLMKPPGVSVSSYPAWSFTTANGSPPSGSCGVRFKNRFPAMKTDLICFTTPDAARGI